MGYDFGLNTFLAGSDGSSYDAPLYYHRLQKELAEAQKRLSSKQKGSNNRKKSRANVVRIHQKIVNLRKDYFFKLAHELTNNYDYIFLEDLNLKGMQQKWGKKVSDLSHATFVNILQYVAQLKGKEVVFINGYYPALKIEFSLFCWCRFAA